MLTTILFAIALLLPTTMHGQDSLSQTKNLPPRPPVERPLEVPRNRVVPPTGSPWMGWQQHMNRQQRSKQLTPRQKMQLQKAREQYRRRVQFILRHP